MDLTIRKSDIIGSFLTPIGKSSEQCILTLKGDKMTCLSHNVQNGLILYGVYNIGGNFDPEINLNIGDVKRLVRVLDCIQEETVTLKIESNKLSYKSKELKFNYHLMEDIVMHRSPIKPEKLNAFQYTTEFDLDAGRIQEILKGSVFAVDSNKMYLYTQDGAVFADLADMTTANTDSIGFKFAESFTGTPITKPMPLHLEAIRLLAGGKFNSIKVKINIDLSVVLFELATANTVIKYILTTRLA
jgi:hypothetical protein